MNLPERLPVPKGGSDFATRRGLPFSLRRTENRSRLRLSVRLSTSSAPDRLSCRRKVLLTIRSTFAVPHLAQQGHETGLMGLVFGDARSEPAGRPAGRYGQGRRSVLPFAPFIG
jgi:hypothetical protein